MDDELFKNFDRFETEYLIERKRMGAEISSEAHAVLDKILMGRGIASPELYGTPESAAHLNESKPTKDVMKIFGRFLVVLFVFGVTGLVASLFLNKLGKVTMVSDAQFAWGLTAFIIFWAGYQMVSGVRNSASSMSKSGKITQSIAHLGFSVIGGLIVIGPNFNLQAFEVPTSFEFIFSLVILYTTLLGFRWLIEIFKN